MNLDKRRPIRKWFVGIKDLCDWTSCKAHELVKLVISYCFILRVLFLHDLSKVMPWQLLLLGMFPIVKAGCGLCRRSCTLFACICQEDMLFHTVYTLFVTFSKRLLRTCLSILGSMFRKRFQFWKEHGIHLNFWFWFQHDSLRLSLRWIAKVEIHPLWFSGFPIRHCSFVIQSKKHLASTALQKCEQESVGLKVRSRDSLHFIADVF